MTCDQIVIDLKVKLACQHEEICLLKEKLVTYDEVLTKKNELQCQLTNLKQCMETVEIDNGLVKKNILTNLDIQTENLRNAEIALCKSRKEIKRLLNINECLAEQINKLEESIHSLQIERDDLEICRDRTLDELRYTNCKVIEIGCILERLRTTLKCTDEQYCNMQCEFNACKSKRERLKETCKKLDNELECKKSEVMSAKLKAKQVEDTLILENDTLSHELEIICQKLRVMDIEYNDANRTIIYNKCNIKNLEMLLVILRETSEKTRCEMNLKIQKLKKEICAKIDNETCMKKQISELQRQNICMEEDIRSLKKQNHENECLLEKMKHSNSMLEEIKNNMYCQLERERNSLLDDLKCQQIKISDLEQQTCCLQGKVREQEIINCRLSCNPCSIIVKTPKICNNSGDDCVLIDELKQLYSNLEHI